MSYLLKVRKQKKMSVKTFIPVAIFVLFISSIISIHKGLLRELLEREICNIAHGPSRHDCGVKGNRVALNFTVATNLQLKQWERTLRLSSHIPAMFTFLALAGIADWLEVKEKIGLYVSLIVALQSLIYMVFAIVRNWSLQYLFFGVLMNILYGDLQGAVLIGWLFATTYTCPDITRTTAFIVIEGMTNAGIGLGFLAVEYLPNHAPLSYIFAASFSCSILCCFLVLLFMPSYYSVISRKSLREQKCKEIPKCKLETDRCNNPFKSLRSEYISGVVITIFLTELGRYGYNAIIYAALITPPIQMSHKSATDFIYGTTTIQGFISIAVGMILVKFFSANDGMLAMISLSGAAFWMALVGFAGSATMLYVLSCTLSVFVPLAVASLYSTGTKENDTIQGNNLMLFALLGFIRMLCQALTTQNASNLVHANQMIYKPFSFILFAILHLMAFILIGSMTLTFKKPIMDVPSTSRDNKLTDCDSDDSEIELFSNQEHVPFLSQKANK